ncbi:hypothetical protein SAMN03159406_02631 [Rhizobium sp. NFR03]|nr:hypothetical protein SAMN03159406_02631 [Rhizobium sp. NFR03]
MGLDMNGRTTDTDKHGEPVMTQIEALQALQDAVKGLNTGDVLVSEELIAERRAEAAAEERDDL